MYEQKTLSRIHTRFAGCFWVVGFVPQEARILCAVKTCGGSEPTTAGVSAKQSSRAPAGCLDSENTPRCCCRQCGLASLWRGHALHSESSGRPALRLEAANQFLRQGG